MSQKILQLIHFAESASIIIFIYLFKISHKYHEAWSNFHSTGHVMGYKW